VETSRSEGERKEKKESPASQFFRSEMQVWKEERGGDEKLSALLRRNHLAGVQERKRKKEGKKEEEPQLVTRSVKRRSGEIGRKSFENYHLLSTIKEGGNGRKEKEGW